jgi:hypothetical protein
VSHCSLRNSFYSAIPSEGSSRHFLFFWVPCRMAGSPNFFIHCFLRFPPKATPATYSFSFAVPAEGDSRHIFILFCGSLRSRFPPLILFRVPYRMANSPTLLIHCILRFLPKEIAATHSILFCGSLRSRFPPLFHSPRPEGQTNIWITGSALLARFVHEKAQRRSRGAHAQTVTIADSG